ncbi:hypothetical protein [Aequorivita flava]|uniref:MORN repeat protein n=1 Tax=Aequorivita flava TaxID=3114371 RepID=A0AB35YYC3_9FLAO
MKFKIRFSISWIFLISITVNAQKIDWVKAPLNPMAFEYKLEHFNLPKGVFAFQDKTFNKDGSVNTALNFDRGVKYFYENGVLKTNSLQEKFEFNYQGYITKFSRPGAGNSGIWTYTYNNKGLLVEQQNQEFKTTYAYDNEDRIISQSYKDGKFTKDYSYKKVGDILEVAIVENNNGKKTSRVEAYKDGFKVYTITSNGDRFETTPLTANDYFTFSEIENKQNNIQIENTQYVSNTMAMPLAANDIKVYVNGKRASFIPINLIDRKQVVLWDFSQKKYLTNVDVTQERNKKLNLILYNVTDNAAYAQIEKSYSGLIHEGNTYTQSVYASGVKDTYINEGFCFFYIEALNTSFSIKTDYPGYYKAIPMTANQHLFFVKHSNGKEFSVVYKAVKLNAESKKIAQSAKNTTYVSLYHSGFPNNEIKVVLPDFNTAKPNELYAAYTLEDFENNPKLNKLTTNLPGGNNLPTTNIIANEETDACISGNCKDGYGVKKVENNIQKGLYLKGKFSSYGERSYGADYYKGEFLNGARDGFGVYYWKDSNQYYYGYWSNGNVHGFGFFVQDGKLLQAGEYENGKQKYNYLLERKQGNIAGCEGDCENGFGKFTYSNGDTYEGFWTAGKQQRVGHYYFKSVNSHYYGSYTNNIMQGPGMYTMPSFTYIGDFEANQLTGKGIKFYSNKTVEAGRWEKGNLVIKY